MSAARRLAVQLCAAGRPALYKLQSKPQQSNSANAAATSDVENTFRQILIPLGQSGVRQIGEDAVFVSASSSFSPQAVVGFGVADGVGGWRDQGVDPGLVSMALMSACSDTAESGRAESLKVALGKAHRGLLSSRPELIGSTTVCLARVTPSTGLLEVANLGDSGLCLLEGVAGGFRVKLRTRFQTNMGGVFNCPMQLAFPIKLSKQYPRPEDCELYSATMEPGDIALVATDGLWDNLYSETIQEIFKHAFKVETDASNGAARPSPLEAAASLLVDAATYLSAQQDYASPFTQSAAAAGLKHVGGKEDDISVVLAMLQCSDDDSASSPMAKL